MLFQPCSKQMEKLFQHWKSYSNFVPTIGTLFQITGTVIFSLDELSIFERLDLFQFWVSLCFERLDQLRIGPDVVMPKIINKILDITPIIFIKKFK
jgi:hypothetical protein